MNQLITLLIVESLTAFWVTRITFTRLDVLADLVSATTLQTGHVTALTAVAATVGGWWLLSVTVYETIQGLRHRGTAPKNGVSGWVQKVVARSLGVAVVTVLVAPPVSAQQPEGNVQPALSTNLDVVENGGLGAPITSPMAVFDDRTFTASPEDQVRVDNEGAVGEDDVNDGVPPFSIETPRTETSEGLDLSQGDGLFQGESFSDAVSDVGDDAASLSSRRPEPPPVPSNTTEPLPGQEHAAPTVERTPSAPTLGHDQTVTVAPGENLWVIARQRLIVEGKTTPSDQEVHRYWVQLIAHNDVPSGDPNLVFPGDQIELPSLDQVM